MNKQPIQIANEPVFSMGSIFRGTVLAYIVTLIMFAVFAIVLSFVDFPDKFLHGAIIITTVISLMVGGTIAGRSARSMGWMTGTMMGILYVVILYILGGIINRNFALDRNIFIVFGISVISGAIGGMIGINLRTKQRLHRKF